MLTYSDCFLCPTVQNPRVFTNILQNSKLQQYLAQVFTIVSALTEMCFIALLTKPNSNVAVSLFGPVHYCRDVKSQITGLFDSIEIALNKGIFFYKKKVCLLNTTVSVFLKSPGFLLQEKQAAFLSEMCYGNNLYMHANLSF